MTVADMLQLVPKLITKVDRLEKELKQTKLTMGQAIVKLVKKVKKMEVFLKRRHVVLTDSEDEDAKNSSKQGRNLQEEGLDKMVRSILKEKSEEFETPTQGKTSGEADISPEGLEAAENLAKVLTQRTKTYTRKVKTGKKGAYQIIREDHTVIVYVNFQALLNDLTRDDLKELYRQMILKYGDSRPEEYERVLWGDLKTMLDPPSTEDAVWSITHQQKRNMMFRGYYFIDQ
ncbi:hypothetical protein Tco_0648616 [Tanacetum coccineum]